MQTQRWKFFQPYNVVSIVVSIYLIVIAVAGLYHGGIIARASTEDVYAKSTTFCSKADRKHVVVGGDTLAHVAMYYGLKEQIVAVYNHLAEDSTLYAGQSICIQGMIGNNNAFNRNLRSVRVLARVTTRMRMVKPVPHPGHGKRGGSVVPKAQPGGVNYASFYLSGALRNPMAVSSGFVNVFSYGQCTWWAAQRYFQLHSVAIPWRSQANAAQWTARAYENGWHVSSVAIVGSVLVLQGGVQGASSLGHVGIVEKVVGGGIAIVSSMNWGYGGGISFDAFSPGPGVAFLEQ